MSTDVQVLGVRVGTAEDWDEIDPGHLSYGTFSLEPPFLAAISHNPEQAAPALGLYGQLNLNYETGEFQLFISSSDEKPAFTGKLCLQGAAT